MGETFDHSGVLELVERSNPTGSGALLSSSGAWEDEVLASSGGTSGNPGYEDDTEYTFIMELTRTAADEIDIFASMAGGNLDGTGSMSASATDVDPASFLFDTFSLRPSSADSTTNQFDTSLFRVELVTAIPEPSSLILIGLALSMGAMATRRGHVC